ncbi:MAG: hypothetical protein JW716_01200 [Candidatus Aenigmarchaeota archaeon]|nr:hypothetical protein [Candidatus Aenigmarchaeota archaeon]
MKLSDCLLHKIRKGQVQVLSLIIITGIVIALVGVAYIWGSPMIEKRTVYTQYTSAEKFMNDLNDRIATLATTCTTKNGCTQTINIPNIDGRGLSVDETGNTLYFHFPSSQRMLASERIALNTPYTGEPADYGTAPPGLLEVEGVTEDSIYLIKFSLHYRELYDEDSGIGYMIKIQGNVQGNNQIIMTYAGTESVSGGSAAPQGGDMTVSTIQLSVL